MPTRRKTSRRGGARPGAGRPKTLQEPKRAIVSLETDVYEALTELSEVRGQSVASLVREAVAEYLVRRRKR